MSKHWLAMTLVLILALAALSGTSLFNQAGAKQPLPANGWQYSNGYWNYWDSNDRAYYHTDGRHWYTYGNNAWAPYNFDRSFGRGYVREGYVVPTPGPTVVVPSHRVVVPVPVP